MLKRVEMPKSGMISGDASFGIVKSVGWWVIGRQKEEDGDWDERETMVLFLPCWGKG